MGCFASCCCGTGEPVWSYRQARKLGALNTGDLVYFCNYSAWTDFAIVLFGGRLVTHVAMIVVLSDGEVAVLEAIAHPGTERDLLAGSGPPRAGVRLALLREKLRIHATQLGGWAYVQPLNTPPATRAHFAERLADFLRRVDGRPYTRDLVAMSCARLAGLSGAHLGMLATSAEREAGLRGSAPTQFYCSELCAEAYRAGGLLSPAVDSRTVWPAALLDREIPLQHGAFLESRGFYLNGDAAEAPPERRQSFVVPEGLARR